MPGMLRAAWLGSSSQFFASITDISLGERRRRETHVWRMSVISRAYLAHISRMFGAHEFGCRSFPDLGPAYDFTNPHSGSRQAARMPSFSFAAENQVTRPKPSISDDTPMRKLVGSTDITELLGINRVRLHELVKDGVITAAVGGLPRRLRVYEPQQALAAFLYASLRRRNIGRLKAVVAARFVNDLAGLDCSLACGRRFLLLIGDKVQHRLLAENEVHEKLANLPVLGDAEVLVIDIGAAYERVMTRLAPLHNAEPLSVDQPTAS
jgi:hypothetical protein